MDNFMIYWKYSKFVENYLYIYYLCRILIIYLWVIMLIEDSIVYKLFYTYYCLNLNTKIGSLFLEEIIKIEKSINCMDSMINV